jgi:DNA (cytosine-5)-methyltransferase 1
MNARGERVAGLFAGIGGLELGFAAHGFGTALLCDSDPGARAVLADRFVQHEPRMTMSEDVRELDTLADYSIVTAGFPCQDLSQAGRTVGISGDRSGLIHTVFSAIGRNEARPTLVIENVRNLLHLGRGEGLRQIIDGLEGLGYRWAYRVIDAQSFGLPQRRERVIIVASVTLAPELVLLGDQADPPTRSDESVAGFYWTEGNTGVGWAKDAIPPLKGGSGLGIPSPPAIAIRGEGIFVPTIEAAERLQGFPTGWTAPIVQSGQTERHRWRLVGNAVPVPMATWIASRIAEPADRVVGRVTDFAGHAPIPPAGFGGPGERRAVELNAYPVPTVPTPLLDVVGQDLTPLSVKATRGFSTRLMRSTLRRQPWFEEELAGHLDRMERAVPVALAAS